MRSGVRHAALLQSSAAAAAAVAAARTSQTECLGDRLMRVCSVDVAVVPLRDLPGDAFLQEKKS